jgi:hypothetical protein
MTLASEYHELDELGGGRFRQTISLKPIAYRKDGSLRRIGNAWGPTGDSAWPMGVDELCDVRINPRIAGKSPLLHFGRGSQFVRFSLVGANNVAGVVSGNRVYFPNAWNNADLEYIIGGHRLQESIILRAGHPRSFGFILQEHTGFDPAALSFGAFRMLDPTLEKGDVSIPLKWIVSSRGGKYHLVVNLPGGDWQGWTLDPTLTLQPAAADGVDTWLSNGSKTRNYGISPTFAGGSGNDRVLFRWDLTSIPATATCVSVAQSWWTTVLHVGNHDARVFQVSDANADFPEGTKTNVDGVAGDCCFNYKNQSPGAETAWAGSAGLFTAGTDYINTVLATFMYTAGSPAGTELSVAFNAPGIAAVQTKFGSSFAELIVNSAGIWGFISATQPAFSDHATAGYRPKLVVNYTLAAGLLMQLQNHGAMSGGTL